MLCIAPTARISRHADIEDSVRGSRIVIEDGVVIDAFVKIKPAGGGGDVIICAGSVINSGCVLYAGNGIRIGRNVLIAANCTLAPTNHAFADRHRPIRTQGFQPSRGGIVVGDDVWIGANCVLTDGTHIGSGAVIGAASLVRGTLPEFCVAFGVPASVRGWRGAMVSEGPPSTTASPLPGQWKWEGHATAHPSLPPSCAGDLCQVGDGTDGRHKAGHDLGDGHDSADDTRASEPP